MKKLKQLNKIAISGLGLSAMSTANASLGGTNLVGQFAQGYGQMLPAVGSLYGTSMIIDAAKMLQQKKRRR